MEQTEHIVHVLFWVSCIIAPFPAALAWWLRTKTNAHAGLVAAAAALAGLLIPGSPQFANGETKKAILVFLLGGLLWWFLLGWIIAIYSAFDGAKKAYQLAKQRPD